MEWGEILNLIIPLLSPLLSLVVTIRVMDYRLEALEKKIESYDSILERIAKIETAVKIYCDME